MKVICSRTNVEFTASGFRDFSISATHPLFSASYPTLLEVSKSWLKGELSEGECRVLFISLLNSTDLIDFRCAATPSAQIVQQYMEYLLVTTNWKNAVGDRIPLARIAINHNTADCKNMGVWLNTWNNTQREFTISSHLQSVRETIAASQKKLLYMLTTGYTPSGKLAVDSDLYAKHLAAWFMVAAGVPTGKQAVTEKGETLQQYWTALFLLKRPEVWNANLADLEEVVAHCESNLPMNSTYAMACYRHLVKLRDDCRDGVLGALSGVSSGDAGNYTIIQEPAEILAATEAAEQAGEDAPVERNFSSKGAYLLARARWRLRASLSFSSTSTSSSFSTSTLQVPGAPEI